MPGIFISYRREDSAGHAGRLFDRLRTEFGSDRVFMDIAGIEAGVDFVDTLERAVASCDALLTVIGPDWLTCTDGEDRRRLDDQADFTRIEIAAALERKIRVIPVLVAGAVMPTAAVLPEDLKPLARRQAAELRDSRWEADTGSLIGVLKRILASADSLRLQAASSKDDVATPVDRPAPPTVAEPKRSWPRRAAILVIIAVIGAFGVVAAPMIRNVFAPTPARPGDTTPPQPADQGTTATEKPQRPPPDAGKTPGASTPDPASPPTATPARIKVPDVRGYTRTTAAETLRGEGFIVVSEAGPSAPGVKTLAVTSQTPAAGTSVPRGSRVSITYARPGRVLPTFVGLTLDDARAQIRTLGFSVGSIVADSSSTAPASQIVRQSPGAGALLDPGAKIDLVYADPPPPIIVPNVVGVDMATALTTLQQAGLTIASRQAATRNDLPAGEIVGQEPAAGRRVVRGTGITLTYASRPAVPQLKGTEIVLTVYAHPDERVIAENLSTYLRSFRFRDHRVIATTTAANYAGFVDYPSEQFQYLARDIASRTMNWLSSEYGGRVVLRTRLVRDSSGEGSITIWLPSRQ